MNVKTWIPLALAIVLGVVAAKVARDVLSKSKAPAVQNVKLAKVINAKTEIIPGHEIKAEDLAEGQVGLESVPSNSFTDIQQLVGRVAEGSIGKNQPIVEQMLAPQGAGAGIQALVPKGMRAITIEVNEFSGIAGLLLPGCRVDVLATITSDAGQVARTIVQNVKVTAVGQRVVVVPKDDANPQQNQEMVRSITLLAKLKEAEAIELAASTGRPRLVLRSAQDIDVTASAGITIGELRGAPRESFWATAAKFIASLPKPTNPVTALASGNPTTRPSEPNKRIVRVYRAGNESFVTLEVRPNTAEASTNKEIQEVK